MRPPHRILDRLTRGLTFIVVAGWLLLTIILIIDFDRLAQRDASFLRHWSDVERIELTSLFAFALTFVAIIVAARRLVKRALAPLHASVPQIDAAIDAHRGFRLDLADLPVEVAGYGEAVNRLIERLERVATQREAFAAAVAHELKNPLAVLVLELDALKSADARRLKADVQKMSRLLDQLMFMARIDAHEMSPPPATAVDLAGLAGDLVAAAAPGAIEHGCQLALTIGDHDRALGHPQLIATALRNLVENAVRVTPTHGTVTVTVGPGARVAVTDQGPGLTPDELTRLRIPFARSLHPSGTGAGLGLAIVDQVAHLHHGTLECDQPARTITLSLPAFRVTNHNLR